MQDQVIFRSKMMHPVLVMKNQKQDRDGNVIQEGSYIYFENFTLATTDEDIINYIRGLRNFSFGYNPNADYYEVSQEDAEKIREKMEATKPNRPTVARMPADLQSEKEHSEVATLSKKVDELTSIVSALVGALPKQTEDQISEQLENPPVRRTRRTRAEIEAAGE